MDCPSGNPVIDLVKGFFSFLGDPIGTIIGLVAKTILAGAVAVFAALTTSVPTLTGTDTSKEIGGQTQWIVVYLAVGSLLFASARMAIERKGDAGRTALKGILRVVLVSGAATTVVTAAAAVSDDYSNHLFNAGVQQQLNNVGACSNGDGIQNFLLLVLAFLLLIAGIIHTILMYIRLGVMILLLGTLPMAAAASMTDWGAGWWRKHIGWMIAWLLYKPAVGLVLYAGSVMITSGSDGEYGGNSVNERIAGIGVMLLSAVALPALLKLIVPATAALGTGNGMAAAGQATSSLATGAVQLGGRGGSSGGQLGPSGASGASGATGSGGSGGSSGSGGEAGATGSGGANGAAANAGRAGAAGAGAGGGASGAAAAAGGPAGVAVLAAVSAAQAAQQTVSGAVDGADGELGHNK